MLHFIAPGNNMPLFPIASSQVHTPLMDYLAVWHLAHTFLYMDWLLLPLPLPISVVYSPVIPDQVGYRQLGVQFLPMIDAIIQEVLVCVNRKKLFIIVEDLVASCFPFDSCGAFNTLHPCVGYCSPMPLFRREQPFLLGSYTAESEQYRIYLSSRLCLFSYS